MSHGKFAKQILLGVQCPLKNNMKGQ